jgi:hypothetical protein
MFEIYTIDYIIRTNGKIMSLYPELKVIDGNNIPKLAVGILAFVAIFSIYIVGYDQGQLFSVVQGSVAFDTMWLHEFTHDIRHAAGFPCH